MDFAAVFTGPATTDDNSEREAALDKFLRRSSEHGFEDAGSRIVCNCPLTPSELGNGSFAAAQAAEE